MKRRLSVSYQLELRKNLPTFHSSNFTLMTTGAFSRNVSKLFSELKLLHQPNHCVYLVGNFFQIAEHRAHAHTVKAYNTEDDQTIILVSLQHCSAV